MYLYDVYDEIYVCGINVEKTRFIPLTLLVILESTFKGYFL